MTEYKDSQEVAETDNELELGTLWRGVRRRLPAILGATALLSLGTYLWSRSQPAVYEASSSVITVRPSDGVVGTTLVTAPPLPQGALDEALRGPAVMNSIVASLRASALPQAVKAPIASDLQQELATGKLTTLNLTSRLDVSGNGVYTMTAQAPSAASARVLANLATQALLNWDEGRALVAIKRALAVQRSQLQEIDRQLGIAGVDDIERQTLIATRAATQRNLANTSIQAQAITGSLALVAEAVQPLNPVAPKPARNAVLVGLLTLLIGMGIAALLTVSDRTVRNEDDLLGYGLPTLGIIPRLRKRDIVFSGIVRAARQAGLYEAIGFLRVNLMTALGGAPARCIMISSTAPGEGKSSLTATLADGLAASGQRVLIIDADLRRGTQAEVWDKYEREHVWHPLVGEGQARTLQEALQTPGSVQVMQVEPNVDLLPAGPGIHDSLGVLNRPQLGDILGQWGQNYDMVLIDSPPLLALADGLILGRHTDGVVLVTEAGQTSLQAVRQVMRRTQNANIRILGAVINKVSQSSTKEYSYGYSYEARPAGRS